MAWRVSVAAIAVDAGAQIIGDKRSLRPEGGDEYNIGEEEVANWLRSHGYEEIANGGVWQRRASSSVTVAGEWQLEDPAGAIVPVTDKMVLGRALLGSGCLCLSAAGRAARGRVVHSHRVQRQQESKGRASCTQR